MSGASPGTPAPGRRNPVWDGYFADPFVLRHGDWYYAYGTDAAHGGTVPALRSRDLVSWEPLGDVLAPLPRPQLSYWAPEVAHRDGAFHMYYSAGGPDGQGHQLRVATAADPAGPFEDAGVVLDPDDPFTIDAHPYQDEDGSWYLFYARDFLDGDWVGTGVVVDRLPDPYTLAGERRVVVRPHAAWQLYESQRPMYGKVWDWYTVEGPFVRRRGDTLFCLYSGGAWRRDNYGVHFATAPHPLGPWTVAPDAGGPTVVRSLPGKVVGPGHACIAQDAGGQDWLVYHAWDAEATARTMRIDPLTWTSEGPRCDGPT